jgi:hypothetical protein
VHVTYLKEEAIVLHRKKRIKPIGKEKNRKTIRGVRLTKRIGRIKKRGSQRIKPRNMYNQAFDQAYDAGFNSGFTKGYEDQSKN